MNTQIIFDNLLKNKVNYGTPEMKKQIVTLRDKIHQEEEELLAQYKPCSSKDRKYISSRLANLNPKLFKELLMDYVYDPTVFISGSCVLDTLIRHNGPIAYQDQLKEFFLNLRQIGTTSSNNYALSTSLGVAPNMFILKTPRAYLDSDLTHELFVGLFGTNKLRQEIPNFAYIFGGFLCSGPMINPITKEVEDFCSFNLPQVQYIIYENVNPNVPLDDYVKTCTPSEFVEKYLQILLALNYANQTIGFTHYDLHSRNVILRQYPDKTSFILKFKTSKETFYLTTDYIATIIDYDVSHIKYKGRNYGSSTFRIEFNVLPQKEFPLYDAYKLLGFCMFSMLDSQNYEAFDEAAKILRYFTEENPQDVILQQRETKYVLPDFDTLISKGLEELIEYIQKVCSCPFLNDNPNGPVMHCGDEIYTCLTQDDFIKRVRLLGSPNPKTILQYYDFITNHKDDISYSKILKRFKRNYTQLISNGWSRMRGFRNEINFLLQNVKLVRVDGSIFTEIGMKKYQEFLSYVARILFIRDRFFFYSIVMEDLMNMMNDLESKGNLIAEFGEFANKLGGKLESILMIINQDNKKLDTLLETYPIKFLVEQTPDFKWLLTDRRSFTFPDELID